MKSFLLFLWNYIINPIPFYYIRYLYFTKVLKNKAFIQVALHRNIDLTCVGGIEIERYTTINKYTYLDGRGTLSIGKNVSISPYVKIITASHSPNSINFEYIVKAVRIEDYVWIGIGAIILPGVTLYEGCIVAAGSIVTKDVQSYIIVAGNPAKEISTRINTLSYNPLWRPLFQ